MADVAVVVPWRGGCPHRETAWTWIRARYAATHPDWPVLVGTAPAGDWCKARAVADAVAQTAAEVLVVADADVWTDNLTSAVDKLTAGAAWVVPHRPVYRLDEGRTAAVLAGAPLDPADASGLDQAPYPGQPGGGIVVLRRSTWEQVPLDPRFVGWGQEDVAWRYALDGVAGGHEQISGPLWHLWHPPQPRLRRRVGSLAGVRLCDRYRAGARRPERLQALVNEARHALQEVTPCASS